MEIGIRKTVILVIESLGVGEAPDAFRFSDRGANSLSHTADKMKTFQLEQFSRLGLGNITYTKGCERREDTVSFYGRMRPRHDGRDTLAGHLELTGINLEQGFRLFPEGFPEELVAELREATGYSFLGNEVSSDYDLIQRLALEHLHSGYPLLSTSADSHLQLSVHERIMSPIDLYDLAEKARAIADKYEISRVTARLFSGNPPDLKFLPARFDLYQKFTYRTLLDSLTSAGIPVVALGTVDDIFNGKGITRSSRTSSNLETLEALAEEIRTGETNEEQQAVIYANLSDMDILYGHSRDPEGYARSLQEVDSYLSRIFRSMTNEDMLFITSVNGSDPTFEGNDYTREYVPILLYSRTFRPQGRAELGVRKSYADLAETISEAYELNVHYAADSFWDALLAHL